MVEEEHPAVQEKKGVWYVLRVLSGREERVRQLIEKEARRSSWGEYLLQVYVPKERVYQVRQGKKHLKEKCLIPGYVLVQVVTLTDEMVEAIRSLPHVVSFLTDAQRRPLPIPEEEVNRFLGQARAVEEGRVRDRFFVGERVKIIEGPFQDFIGVIEEVQEEKQQLRVMVPIFGRNTPVIVSYHEVEPVSEEG